jgi:hypothetical protein
MLHAGEIRDRLAAIRDIPCWRQALAWAWWKEYGEALQTEPEGVSDLSVTRSLAVDPNRMR